MKQTTRAYLWLYAGSSSCSSSRLSESKNKSHAFATKSIRNIAPCTPEEKWMNAYTFKSGDSGVQHQQPNRSAWQLELSKGTRSLFDTHLLQEMPYSVIKFSPLTVFFHRQHSDPPPIFLNRAMIWEPCLHVLFQLVITIYSSARRHIICSSMQPWTLT